jgi:hypothetical protein
MASFNRAYVVAKRQKHFFLISDRNLSVRVTTVTVTLSVTIVLNCSIIIYV